MKSIKIKLDSLNQVKTKKLEQIFSYLEKISEEYLKIRLDEIQNSDYRSPKNHYQYFRYLYPNLNSGILQSRLRNIDWMLKSYISWCKKKKKLVTYPKNVKVTLPLRNDMFKFSESNTEKFTHNLRLLRTNFPVKLCNYHQKTLEDATKICDSSILRENGGLVLRLVFKTKTKQNAGTKKMGVDLGITKPIVCSDGKQFGSGGHIRHKKIEFGKKRARNQKLKQKINRKQSNWTSDTNHKLSKELVDYCLSQQVNVLVVEKLKGHQLSNRKFRKFSWAFKDLIEKIKYKCENMGIKVVEVNPAYTSQRCSSCGLKSKDNRKTQSLFECDSCKFRANADLNASKNILVLSD